jgi:cytochrome c oxidase subunit 2
VTALFVLTFTTMRRLEPPGTQTTVTVTGHQWWWQVQYGPTAVTANEIHLPLGTQVRIALKSADVIHSFWVPQLAGKTDMTPGRTTFTGFTATSPGWYLGECSEFCGAQHAHMRFWVKIETPEEFAAWVRLQESPAGDPAPGDATKGRDLFLAKPCVGCHTIRGTVAAGTTGPDLTHVGGRRSLAAGTLDMTPADVAAWILDPQTIKPGALMPVVGLTPEEARLLAAYLTELR